MTLREQPGVPTRFTPLQTRTPERQTPGASRQRVGTSSGLHPEDRPSQTDEHRYQGPTKKCPVFDALDDDDDEMYNTRVPSSARRYAPTTTPPRTVMRVTRHQGPPPPIQRASRNQAPTTEEPEQIRIRQSRRSLHPSVYIGIAMLVMLIGWILFSSLSHWWQNEQDTLHYGNPRTFQIDADVRHGGISHFTVENLNGHILIIEVHVTNLAKARIYVGPTFSGAEADLQPATLSFEDVNGDSYPDMIISVGTGRYLLINDHTGFRAPTVNDMITGKGI